MSVNTAWAKLRSGGLITTCQLKKMRSEIDAALPLLMNHTQMGCACRCALLDRANINSYLNGRGHFLEEEAWSGQGTRESWKNIRNGDFIAAPQLKKMRSEIDAALPLLMNHTQMGCACRCALLDRAMIQSYLDERSSVKKKAVG